MPPPELKQPRRIEEFRGVFSFLDKNVDGKLNKDEMRYIMDATGNFCNDDELNHLIEEITGGKDYIDEPTFLHFCWQQLQEDKDPREELLPAWKEVSSITDWSKKEEIADSITPKYAITADMVPQPAGKSKDNMEDKTLGLVCAEDIIAFMKKLGEEIAEEEAEELIMQSDKQGKTMLLFEEFVQLLTVPSGKPERR